MTAPARPPAGWSASAACTAHPHLPWDTPGDSAAEPAILVCNGCPVRRACLAAADIEEADVSDTAVYGVRGGLTATERIRRRRWLSQHHRAA